MVAFPQDRATAVVVRRAQRVLLIRKRYGVGQGFYTLPGGKLHPSEPPSQGAVRELHEEAGLTVAAVHRRGEVGFDFGDNTAFRLMVFEAGETSGFCSVTAEGLPRWFAADKLPFEQMWPDAIHWLPLTLNRSVILDASFCYQGGRLASGVVNGSIVDSLADSAS